MTDLLTVPEAATLAGVSERTMRRWAAGGQVRTVVTGHKRRVVADSLLELPARIGQGGQEFRLDSGQNSATVHEADRLADLVRDLSERLAEQMAMTALWMERARVLSEQLALAAPQSAAERPQDARETAEGSEPIWEPSPASEPVSSPWWRRWLSAVSGW